MTYVEKSRLAARAKYYENVETALSMVRRLEEKLNEMNRDLTAKNWADVGDVHENCRELKNTCDRIFLEGEYAPENN
jgi:hypothetical protein